MSLLQFPWAESSQFIGTLNGWRWTEKKCQGQPYSAVSVGSPEFKDGVSSSDESYSIELSDGAVTVPTSWEPDIRPWKISLTKRLCPIFTSPHCAFRNCPLQLISLKQSLQKMNWKPFGDIQNSTGQDPSLTSKLALNLKLAMFWVGGWTKWHLEAPSSLNYSLILWSDKLTQTLTCAWFKAMCGSMPGDAYGTVTGTKCLFAHHSSPTKWLSKLTDKPRWGKTSWYSEIWLIKHETVASSWWGWHGKKQVEERIQKKKEKKEEKTAPDAFNKWKKKKKRKRREMEQ